VLRALTQRLAKNLAISGKKIRDEEILIRRTGAGNSDLSCTCKPTCREWKIPMGDDVSRAAPWRGTEPHLGLSLAPARDVEGSGGQGIVVLGVGPNGSAARRTVYKPATSFSTPEARRCRVRLRSARCRPDPFARQTFDSDVREDGAGNPIYRTTHWIRLVTPRRRLGSFRKMWVGLVLIAALAVPGV
jgi:hypothetical protein